uniref:Uncharacterized protein n=1 Tax=viral metagenome TaxID=1070528 RepID=A0A6M3LEB1_9ZZZZ
MKDQEICGIRDMLIDRIDDMKKDLIEKIENHKHCTECGGYIDRSPRFWPVENIMYTVCTDCIHKKGIEYFEKKREKRKEGK